MTLQKLPYSHSPRPATVKSKGLEGSSTKHVTILVLTVTGLDVYLQNIPTTVPESLTKAPY